LVPNVDGGTGAGPFVSRSKISERGTNEKLKGAISRATRYAPDNPRIRVKTIRVRPLKYDAIEHAQNP
jgi:hypothetical protein